MATYTTIDITKYESGDPQYKAQKSHFYMQGFPVYLDITAPTDKTVVSGSTFKYICDIATSKITAVTSSGTTSYRYENSFTPYATGIALTQVTSGDKKGAWTTNIPSLGYDAAVRFTVYVQDDATSTKIAYNTPVVVYAYAYTAIEPTFLSSSWDNDSLNFSYKFKLTGPKLSSGTLTNDYYWWFNNTMNGDGWSTYFNDIFISTSSIAKPSTTPLNTSPMIRGVMAAPNANIDGYYFYSKGSYTWRRIDNTGQNLVFTPDGNASSTHSTYNVGVERANNEFIVTIKGINQLSSNPIDLSAMYYIYIQVYNASASNDSRNYLGTLSAKLIPPIPIMQMRKNGVNITAIKDSDQTGSLVIDNPSDVNTIKDNIALYKSKTKVNCTSTADAYPSIGFYGPFGNNGAIIRYFDLYMSDSEAEAWYDLIGHA